MVTFRFHLLSLTAVFLALAVGIAIGATVVDQATVDALQKRLDNFEHTERENARLRGQVGDWERFSEEAADEFVEGRLNQHPVLVVTVQGVDRGLVHHGGADGDADRESEKDGGEREEVEPEADH